MKSASNLFQIMKKPMVKEQLHLEDGTNQNAELFRNQSIMLQIFLTFLSLKIFKSDSFYTLPLQLHFFLWRCDLPRVSPLPNNKAQCQVDDAHNVSVFCIILETVQYVDIVFTHRWQRNIFQDEADTEGAQEFHIEHNKSNFVDKTG